MGGRLDARQNGSAEDVDWGEEGGSRLERADAAGPTTGYVEWLGPGPELDALDVPGRRLKVGRGLGALRVGEISGIDAIERGSAPGVPMCVRR